MKTNIVLNIRIIVKSINAHHMNHNTNQARRPRHAPRITSGQCASTLVAVVAVVVVLVVAVRLVVMAMVVTVVVAVDMAAVECAWRRLC